MDSKDPSAMLPAGGVEPPTPSAAPDWDRVHEEILCPLCEYSLRGISEPRCPECGYTFEWRDILDPRRRFHPYLFEHHVTRRLRWFRKTLVGGYRPGRFWRSLHPVQAVYPRRLLGYWCLLMVPCIAMVAAVAAAGVGVPIWRMLQDNRTYQAQQLAGVNPAAPPAWVVRSYGSYQGFLKTLEAQWPTKFRGAMVRNQLTWWLRRDIHQLMAPVAVLVWPWMTLGALLVFQVSMRRAKIKARHVLRCVVYSFDAVPWIVLAVAGVLVLEVAMPGRQGEDLVGWLFLSIAAVGLMIVYRLVQAYRLYLHFDRPILTVLASQVIAGLAVAKFIALFTIDMT